MEKMLPSPGVYQHAMQRGGLYLSCFDAQVTYIDKDQIGFIDDMHGSTQNALQSLYRMTINDPQQPYPHNAFSTPDDPTPGGPMVGGVGLNQDTLRSMEWLRSQIIRARNTEQQYVLAIDPEASPDNIPFSVALEYAKAGRPIARKGWPKDCDVGLLMKYGRLFGAPVLYVHTGGYAMPMQDILANDWYVLSEPVKDTTTP